MLLRIARKRKVDVQRLVAEMDPKPDIASSIGLVAESGNAISRSSSARSIHLGFREREADRAVATLDPLAWHRPPEVLIRDALRVLT